jgi:hypothetical protein
VPRTAPPRVPSTSLKLLALSAIPRTPPLTSGSSPERTPTFRREGLKFGCPLADIVLKPHQKRIRGGLRKTPGTASDLLFYLVAGAGFEPATSGRHQRRRDNYGVKPEATDSLGVVRDSPSLPVSEYPSSTE